MCGDVDAYIETSLRGCLDALMDQDDCVVREFVPACLQACRNTIRCAVLYTVV